MTKSDLIASVAESASINKTQATTVVGAVFDTITQALAEGDKVQIVGFGSFEVRERAERNGRDPRSGEVITIAATKAPVFKAGSALKEAVKD